MVPLGTNTAASLPSTSRHLFLETSHRRVLAPHIVTDLGARHGGAHALVGNGQRVTAKIDGVPAPTLLSLWFTGAS